MRNARHTYYSLFPWDFPSIEPANFPRMTAKSGGLDPLAPHHSTCLHVSEYITDHWVSKSDSSWLAALNAHGTNTMLMCRLFLYVQHGLCADFVLLILRDVLQIINQCSEWCGLLDTINTWTFSCWLRPQKRAKVALDCSYFDTNWPIMHFKPAALCNSTAN